MCRSGFICAVHKNTSRGHFYCSVLVFMHMYLDIVCIDSYCVVMVWKSMLCQDGKGVVLCTVVSPLFQKFQNNPLVRYLFHFMVYYRSTFNNHGNQKKGKEENRTRHSYLN